MRRALLLALLLAVSSPAQASGLRVLGSWTLSPDTSFDVFSSTDWRSDLDVSFSYTFLYAARLFLLDVEGGYRYTTRIEDTLYDLYSTSLDGHSMYLGLRFQARIDRPYIEWLQPYVRIDFGWLWVNARLSRASMPMTDRTSNGFIYVGGGAQVTVPTSFIRNRLHIKATERFTLGFTYELGFYQPGPLRIRLAHEASSATDAEPIPVGGFAMGSLDLMGMVHSFGFVLTF